MSTQSFEYTVCLEQLLDLLKKLDASRKDTKLLVASINRSSSSKQIQSGIQNRAHEVMYS